MNTISNDFAKQVQDFTDKTADKMQPRALEQFRFTGDFNMLGVIARWCHNSLLTALALLTIAIVVSTM